MTPEEPRRLNVNLCSIYDDFEMLAELEPIMAAKEFKELVKTVEEVHTDIGQWAVNF